MLWGEVSLRRAQNKLENFSAVGTIVHYVHNLAVVLCISKSMYCGLKNGEIVGKNFPIFPQPYDHKSEVIRILNTNLFCTLLMIFHHSTVLCNNTMYM